MTTYYIDPTAAAGGNGLTPATAFDSWADVTFVAGNIYLQKAGTTFTTVPQYQMITVGVTGTEASPIILGAYDPATGMRVTGGDQRAKIDGTGSGITVRVSVVDWITVENFEIFGTDANTVGATRAIGLYLGSQESATANHCTVFNCYIHDINPTLYTAADSNGIQAFGSYNVIDSCIIENIREDGIWIQGAYNRIVNNTISNVSLGSTRGDCIQITGASVLANVGSYIGYNTLDHSNKNSKQVIICGGIGYASNAIIEHNYCVMATYDNVISTTCIFSEAANSVIRNNVTIGGYFGIYVNEAADNKIYGNVVKNSIRGFNPGTNATDTIITNNLISGHSVHGIYSDIYTSTIVKNNVIMNCATGVAMESGIGEDYNIYYNNTTDKALLGGAASWGANSQNIDPLLSSTYHPFPDSPCLDGGADLGYMRDMEGKQCKKHIGAYGYARVI